MKTIKDQYFDGERPLYESRDLRIKRVTIGEGESGLKESRHIEAFDCEFEGMYVILEAENVTVYDSEIKGECLGWYSKNLRLVRCRISGTQPLCYCQNLILESCLLDDSCDRAFEKSTYSII